MATVRPLFGATSTIAASAAARLFPIPSMCRRPISPAPTTAMRVLVMVMDQPL
jgi:hypothetical protein